MGSSSILVAGIVTAEVLFWVLLLGGLAARYLVRARRLSTVLLVGVPLADLVLVLLTVVDLLSGSVPGNVHGLAAIYLGFSVAFGPYIVRRVDPWFAHRFAGGPAPEQLPASGPVRLRHEWQSMKRMLGAWALAVPLLLIMVVVSGWRVPTSAAELFGSDPIWAWIGRITLVLVIWFVTGPVYYALFRWRAPEGERSGRGAGEGSARAEGERSARAGRSAAPRRAHRQLHLQQHPFGWPAASSSPRSASAASRTGGGEHRGLDQRPTDPR